jgi:hypothetical protein
MIYYEKPWYKDKLTALLAIIMGVCFVIISWYHYQSSLEYRPIPQQVFLDEYNRPLGRQNLLEDTFHNPQYRKGNKGETASDFLTDALLSTFHYNYNELNSGEVLDRFLEWCSEDEAIDLYSNAFVNLSSQRIIKAQLGISEPQVIGDWKLIKEGAVGYQSTSGLSLESKTFLFEGTLMLEVHADSVYPTVYQVSAVVQRALIQDKIKGYQLINLELR